VADSTDQGFRHFALLYRDIDDYLLGIANFLQTGAAAGEPALVAVPATMQEQVRLALDRRPISGEWSAVAGRIGRASGVGGTGEFGCTGSVAAASLTATQPPAPTVYTDMSELGRNPARIMPSIQAFIDAASGDPIRFVGEPIWPGRSAAEICEAIRHEALINQAFAPTSASILCPYDVSGLPERVIADACRTHPVVISDGRPQRSQAFAGPHRVPAGCDDPLPGVPADATVAAYARDLRAVRTLVAEEARRARLSKSRTVDLVLAVSEVAANTLRHTAAGGTICLWLADGELICQLADTGHITDPLAGRRPPNRDHPGGQGLWLVNQVCDLVELRTGQGGTVVRLHMRLPTNHLRR
jgi:anti-sigma regulatory factor (Ser/Thr protein kinase)